MRKTYQDRTRGYALRESEVFMLKELGKFRVISAEDLNRFGYDEKSEPFGAGSQHLKNQGLVSDRQIEAYGDPNCRVLTLTRKGRRFLRHQDLIPKEHALYDGFVKPKELAHDAGLYQRIATEIEMNGGSIRRVILDSGLKSEQDLSATLGGGSKSGRREARAESGSRQHPHS